MNVEKLIIFGFVVLLTSVIPQPAFAQTTDEPTITAGVTPDSWLYGLDVAIDQIALLLTFDNGAKARKGLEVARERLLEVKEMVEEKKLDAAERAQSEHANVLGRVQSAVRGIERANSTEELEEEIEIEMELEKHKEEIEMMQGELKVKIEVEGVITPEQQALIDSILSSLENKTGEVEIEIENEEDETKIKIEVETGESGEEVEVEIERKVGLTEKREERAQDRIEDAREEIEEVEEKIIEENITITDIPGLEQLLGEAEAKLESAELAFADEDYGEAFGQATAAKQLAKNAGKLIEIAEETKVKAEVVGNATQVNVKVKFMSTNTERNILAQEILDEIKLSRGTISDLLKIEVEEEELEEKLKAEIKVREGVSKVKVMFEFPLNTTETDEIIDGIYDKLSALTIEDITNVLEIKVKERELETKVEIEEGKAKVRLEVNDVDMKFTLNTTDRDEIIAEIANRTGLTIEEIEQVIEFEEKIEGEKVECVTDLDCKEDETCIEGECEKVEKHECTVDADCKENEICVEGECEKVEEPETNETET